MKMIKARLASLLTMASRILENEIEGWVWWLMPVIPECGKQRQEKNHHKFKVYTAISGSTRDTQQDCV